MDKGNEEVAAGEDLMRNDIKCADARGTIMMIVKRLKATSKVHRHRRNPGANDGTIFPFSSDFT